MFVYGACMSAPITVTSFLLVERAGFDEHTGLSHLSGVGDTIWINPETNTNDRYDIAVEVVNATRLRMEFRITKHEGVTDVWRSLAMWERSRSPYGNWVFFTLISLEPGTWELGVPHSLELWTDDRRIARRTIRVQQVEDVESDTGDA